MIMRSILVDDEAFLFVGALCDIFFVSAHCNATIVIYIVTITLGLGRYRRRREQGLLCGLPGECGPQKDSDLDNTSFVLETGSPVKYTRREYTSCGPQNKMKSWKHLKILFTH
ncbi:hypothetical protein GUJ93_ZPchr0007g5127 [Zizania palustris]|uniref:Uncharacterized protein n=1 Tax=Zizania palustris TaxID=103762 RepID=A0A8J5TIF2_ZIZPA|nr:hypothetical protein GUJ93_ZPchr0007g5127 [Zizania palustris]